MEAGNLQIEFGSAQVMKYDQNSAHREMRRHQLRTGQLILDSSTSNHHTGSIRNF